MPNVSIKKLIIISVLVRILLMPFFAYPEDIFATHLTSLEILRDWHTIFSVRFSLFSHLIDSLFMILFHPLLPENLRSSLSNLFYIPHINRVLFLFKLPYLLAEYATYYILYKIFDLAHVKADLKRKLLLFLLFNPIILYVIYIFGRFESYNLLISCILVYLLAKKNIFFFWKDTIFFTVILIIAFFTREYYLLLGISVLLLKGKWSQKITTFLITYGTYFGFLMMNQKKSVILNSYGQLDYFFGTKVPYFRSYYLYFFFLVIGIIACYLYFHFDFKTENNAKRFNLFSFLSLTAIFSITFFNPQYFAWIIPFWAISTIYIRDNFMAHKIVNFYWIVSGLYLLTLFKSSNLIFGAMFPLASTFRFLSFDKILPQYGQYADAAQSIFSGLLLMFVFYYLHLLADEKKVN